MLLLSNGLNSHSTIRSVSCFFTSCKLSCLSSVQLSVSGLFKDLDLQLLQPMSLTLMHSSTPLANDSTISLDPMEISAFKLKLR